MNDKFEFSLNELIENKVKNIAKREKLVRIQPMIVVNASVANGASTPLYYPSDTTNQTQSYKNLTGQTIVAGQRVYLIQPAFSDDEGWIAYV